jgi:hypothetical protein
MFRKEELVAMGITEEIATKIIKEQDERLKVSFVSKERFNEVNSELKEAKASIDERDKQIKTLKAFEGTNEELKTKIDSLQKDLKLKDEESQKMLKQEKLNNAIKLGVLGFESKPHDVDMVTSLIDTTKVVLTEDGKVSGLTEQLKEIQKAKAFLFQENEQKQQKQNEGFKFFGKGLEQGDKRNGENTTEYEQIGLAFANAKLQQMGIKPKEKKEE